LPAFLSVTKSSRFTVTAVSSSGRARWLACYSTLQASGDRSALFRSWRRWTACRRADFCWGSSSWSSTSFGV